MKLINLGAVVCTAVIGVVAVARFSNAGEGAPSTAILYPYVVPATYLQHGGQDLSRPLGHGMHVALVPDFGTTVQSATGQNLHDLRLSVDQARRVALQNLERLVASQQVKMAVLPSGPGSKPFVLVGGHWAAATSILLPNLAHTVAVPLGTQDLCASIPHREAMPIFSCGDRAYRDSMRALVQERESRGGKPLTFGLFRLSENGVEPLVE
jgi:hypothetical protein